MPESSGFKALDTGFKALDTGLRRYDELITVFFNLRAEHPPAPPRTPF